MPAAWVAGAAALVGAASSYDAAGNASKKQQEGTDKAIASTERYSNLSRQDLAPYKNAGTAALARLQQLAGLAPPPGTSTRYDGQTPLSRQEFDPQAYLDAYSDVARNTLYNTDPYLHYMTEGQQTGTYRAAFKQNPGDVPNPTDSPLLRKFTAADLANDPVYNSGLQFGVDEGTKAIARKAAAGGGYDSGAEDKAIARFANDYGSTKAADSYGRFRDYQDTTFGKLSGISGMGTGATSVGVNAGTAAGSNLAALQSGAGNAAGAAAIAQGNSFNNAANTASQYALLRQLSGGGQRTTTSTTNPNAIDT